MNPVGSDTTSTSTDWLASITNFISTAAVPTIQAIKGTPVAAPARTPTTASFGAGVVSKPGIAGLSTTTVIGIGALGLIAYSMMKKKGRRS